MGDVLLWIVVGVGGFSDFGCEKKMCRKDGEKS
jgi:hypothetical protein